MGLGPNNRKARCKCSSEGERIRARDMDGLETPRSVCDRPVAFQLELRAGGCRLLGSGVEAMLRYSGS